MLKIAGDCPRGGNSCIALSNIKSDCGTSFFCCGENDRGPPPVEQDKYTLCFKGEFRDDMTFHDKRDLTHQGAVIAQALAIVQGDDGEADWSPWEATHCCVRCGADVVLACADPSDCILGNNAKDKPDPST